MNRYAPSSELRTWITDHLDPLEGEPGPKVHSDYDLDPTRPPSKPHLLTPAAVLVGLVERPRGLSVILTKRSETLRRHTGQVALPGGRCDPGETVWETALREAQEEIGLDPSFVSLAGLTTPHETGTNYLITPVVGFVQEGFELTPNADEVAEIFETPFAFLMEPSNYEEREAQLPTGERRRYYAMNHENRMIWGATAGILRALYERLFGAAIA